MLKDRNNINLSSFAYPSSMTSNDGVISEHHCKCECNTPIDCDPAEYNFNIDKGADFDIDIQYKSEDGTPINLTGFSVSCAAQFNNKVFTIPAVITDAEMGMINLKMSGYDTSKIYTLDYKYMNYTEYTYQLNVIAPNKSIYRILQGTIFVSPNAGSCVCR